MSVNEITKILYDNYDSDTNFKFVEETHVYTYKEEQYISVTTFLQRFHKPFLTDFWARKKANERGVSIDVILEEWRVINVTATDVGTATHNWIENYFNKIYQPLPTDISIIERINKFNIIFSNRLHKLIPVAFEKRIYSHRLKISGCIDAIFINPETNEIYILDWKTNASIKTDADHAFENLLSVFKKYKKNHVNEYSIQLSLYALILAEVGIDISQLFIVHIPKGDAPCKIHKCVDMRKELIEYFENHYNPDNNNKVH